MATQKIHFFTGKGGVGKSTVAAAFATQKSDQNTTKKPVLLAELGERSFYQDFLNLKSISYTPQAVKSLSAQLDVARWSGQDCLKDYVLYHVKVEALYKLFFQNPVSRALINAAPALEELAILGKATSEVRSHGPALEYSEIVIDAYSTGHFLSLIKAPEALAEIISFGPMGEQTRSINQWLRNTDFMNIHIVSLPELLPLTESVELYAELKAHLGIAPRFYLNKVSSYVASDLAGLSSPTKKIYKAQLDLLNECRHQLKNKNISFLEIPFVPDLNGLSLVQKVAQYV